MADTLLEIKKLKTYFFRDMEPPIKAVDGVDIAIHEGETVCVVGESGSGKSIMALSVMDLIEKPKGRIVEGEILLEGRNIVGLSEKEICEIRGDKISMIFQEPMTSLNPVMTIEKQIGEMILLHEKADKKTIRERTLEMLTMVGIPRPDKIMKEYPHQLSGGMRQRIMIAIALICSPRLLIADEPTTALDVTIQAQVLDIMNRMKQELGTAMLFITHDMGVVSEMADYVVVMYAGQVVECAPAEELFEHPAHPYTRALMASIPFMNQDVDILYSIKGVVADAGNFPKGCRFAERCECCMGARCTQDMPGLTEIGPGHKMRCWKKGDNPDGRSDSGS